MVWTGKSKPPPCPAKEGRDKDGTPSVLEELACAAEGLSSMDGGDAGDSGYRHAGEKLHGGHIAFVEGSGGGR